MAYLSKSKAMNNGEAPYWLKEKVYERKKQRTIQLVKQAVDALLADKQRISLSTVSRKSKEIDPDGFGVSESAILNNEEARTYYERYRTWKGNSRRRRKANQMIMPPPRSINPDRDVSRVRQRLMRLSKTELVERVLYLEQAIGVQEKQWLELNDELLYWRLRSEQAEARLSETNV